MIKNDEDYLIRRTYTNYGGRKMNKELYFECECGGKAIFRIFDLVDEENKFNVSTLGQSVFECEECGKRYYCGEWEDFCWSEDEL